MNQSLGSECKPSSKVSRGEDGPYVCSSARIHGYVLIIVLPPSISQMSWQHMITEWVLERQSSHSNSKRKYPICYTIRNHPPSFSPSWTIGEERMNHTSRAMSMMICSCASFLRQDVIQMCLSVPQLALPNIDVPTVLSVYGMLVVHPNVIEKWVLTTVAQ